MKRILLLGSGELGKEFAIAAKRAGQYVIACDRYDNATPYEASFFTRDAHMKGVLYGK